MKNKNIGKNIWKTYETNMKTIWNKSENMVHEVSIIPRILEILEIEVSIIPRILEILEIWLLSIFVIFTKKTRAEISRRTHRSMSRDLSYETDSGPKTKTV